MAFTEFSTCAESELGFAVDSWEAVATELVAIAQYIQNNETLLAVVEYAAEWGAEWVLAALAPIAAAAGVSVSEAVAAVIVSFAAGVGVGTGIWIVANCGNQLAA
jgi:hypothetical protein